MRDLTTASRSTSRRNTSVWVCETLDELSAGEVHRAPSDGAVFVSVNRKAGVVCSGGACRYDDGPVVLGTAWFSEMSQLPRGDNVALPRGQLQGGHAYLAIGYEPAWEAVVCVNSWGRDWGDGGIFYLWQDHLAWLVQNHGEACVAIERREEELPADEHVAAVLTKS